MSPNFRLDGVVSRSGSHGCAAGRVLAQLCDSFHSAWQMLREACGENDYERYAARARALGLKPATPQAFYLSRLRRKYSQPARCC